MRFDKSKLIIVASFAIFIVCLVVGLVKKIGWLTIVGIAVFIVTCVVFEIVRKVKLMREVHEALEENDTTMPELMASAVGLGKESREKLKKAPIGDKLKVIAIFGSLGLTMLVFIAGIFLSNIGITKVGFPLMAAGGGGFFLTLILLIVISGIQSKVKVKRIMNPPKSQSECKTTEVLRHGIVEDCSIDLSYTNIDGIVYNVTIRQEHTQNFVKVVCMRRYSKGADVRYFQSVRNPQKCRLIDEN